jgi:UDP-N-acetylglucosamine--N-acetylmuramyl-(pentapeptide) pyrophosphoryl-undecaprenol N-acetylglucosamine transferase
MTGDALDVLIAGGGTGGHVFPGLALADALRERGQRVGFVGTPAGLEARAVPAAGYPIDLIPGRQVRGGGIGRALGGVAALATGVAHARRLLETHRPKLVVGVGGYASVAAVVAARLGRLPVVLMEQNAIPGLANRTLGRVARVVCVGFAEAAPFFPPRRSIHTGNPIRPAVLAAPPSLPHDRPGLLVFGGSQGATHVNDAAVAALEQLGDAARTWRITHQTGAADRDRIAAAYAALGLDVRVEAFITDMGSAYRAADVVVARAGAMSCAEITAMGLPAVLVPYPYAADDHQRRNAEVLADAGAAVVILDRQLDGSRLATALRPLIDDADRRRTMAMKSRALGRPEAARTAADVCLRVIANHPLEDHLLLR